MPEEFELDDLDLPEDSGIETLLERCPDIQKQLFRDGDFLVREGEGSQETYVVLQGSYIVEHEKKDSKKGRSEPLAVQFADEESISFVGEMAYLGSGKRTASVRCSGSVYTLVLKPEHIDIILDEFPFFGRVLSRRLAEHLRDADKRIKKYRADFEMSAQHTYKDKGDVVVKAGDPVDVLYQLVDGSVIKEGPDGEEVLGVTQSPSDFLNARAYFSGRSNDITIRAKTQCIFTTIAKESKSAVVRNFPDLVLSLLRESKR